MLYLEGGLASLQGVQSPPDTRPEEGPPEEKTECQAVHSFAESVHGGLRGWGWLIGKHEAALGPMCINGENKPLHDVVPWFECLWQAYAHLTRGTRSRQPALINAFPRLYGTSAGVQNSPKDFNAAELSLDRFVKPEPYLTGRLGDYSPGGGCRAYESGMRGQEPWAQDERTEQHQPPGQKSAGLTAVNLKHQWNLPHVRKTGYRKHRGLYDTLDNCSASTTQSPVTEICSMPRGGRMYTRVLAKTAGFTLVDLMVVVAIMTSLAAAAVPTFVAYRDRSRIVQVIGSSEAIRAALASYAAGHAQNTYPLTGAITDFNSLRLLVNAHGGMLPPSASFTVDHYDFYDSDGDGIADTYSMRLIVNGVQDAIAGAHILLTPQGIFKCVASGNPC